MFNLRKQLEQPHAKTVTPIDITVAGNGSVDIRCGDCLEVLKTLPSGSVNCCVTSPPYFGLRDYGVDGQIGLEQTPDEYVSKMVGVLREVKRVLRDDGTLWLNIGDSYNGSGKGTGQVIGNMTKKQVSNFGSLVDFPTRIAGLKSKDLIGIPWMLAFALRADGWYLRQDIIWAKLNPMPESMTDRCTRAHEYVFLLAKSNRYYFDNKAIEEPAVSTDNSIRDRDHTKMNNTPGRTRMKGCLHNKYLTRNKRDVWTVTTRPFKGAHFAVFPEKLIEPCILAGCPAGGTVLDPFAGSGTVGVVAKRFGRNSLLIELNPEYIKIIEKRMEGV